MVTFLARMGINYQQFFVWFLCVLVSILVPTLMIMTKQDPSDEDIVKESWLPEKYDVQVFHSAALSRPRSLHVLPSGDVLVVDTSNNHNTILLFWDDDMDGHADGHSSLFSTEDANKNKYGLTHGIEYIIPKNNKWTSDGEGLLLASSDHTVWYWSFTDDPSKNHLKGNFLGQGKKLITNMNAKANEDDLGAERGHWTRTLALSPLPDQRYLMVSVGSAGNVDNDSYRSRIRRFDLWNKPVSNNAFDFRTGEVFADGLRNTVGLALDRNGILWGVENGADQLIRNDLGGDIHNDNPAEELNKFDGPIGTFYGYPYCWTEYKLPLSKGKGKGTVWAWPKSGEKNTDEWCQNNSRPSEVAMQAHSAPLGITFYEFKENTTSVKNCKGAFPKDLDGDAFIAFHGSWNRDIPTGYKVVHIPFDLPGGDPLNATSDLGVKDIFRYNGKNARWPSGVRPVDVKFDACGRLLVSDDGANRIYTISYNSVSPKAPTNISSMSPNQSITTVQMISWLYIIVCFTLGM